MKRILIVFVMCFSCLSIIVQISRDSMISLSQMAIIDTAGYQRAIALEAFTANYAANQTNLIKDY